jgi:hypothetical protein
MTWMMAGGIAWCALKDLDRYPERYPTCCKQTTCPATTRIWAQNKSHVRTAKSILDAIHLHATSMWQRQPVSLLQQQSADASHADGARRRRR